MGTVLIVDDEKIVLDVLQRILARLGYTAIVTDSGESALKQFSEESFDLVLMDVLMPDRNGFEIAREMRQIRPDQKIVLVTGIGADAAAAQADSERICIDNILSKPFSYDKVKMIVKNALEPESQFTCDKVLYH